MTTVMLTGMRGMSVAHDEPVDTGVTEQVRVNLVLLETLVLDRKGRTVSDLTRDDFILKIQNRRVPIDVLDIECPAGQVDDARNVEWEKGEVRAPAVLPALQRPLVLVFDYYHLSTITRGETLNQAQAMVLQNKAPGEEIMVVALADGLRIEQRFTNQLEQVADTLRRMEHDVTLYARDFATTVTDRAFFDDLARLSDVLENYDGAKAMVLFSQLVSRADDWDLWFENVAKRAAAARTVIYPIDSRGLQAGGPVGGSPSLARLATQSGGRFTYGTNDYSLAYARAQRDLACRYTVGFYIDADEIQERRAIKIQVKRSGVHVYSPEIIRYWSEKERRKARHNAAFNDPQLFEEPLIRTQVFPIRPRSSKTWDGLVVVHAPWPVGPAGVELELSATLSRGRLPVQKFQRVFRLDPPSDAENGVRTVTLVGRTKLRPGAHSLTVVVSKAGDDGLSTSWAEFAIPDLPHDGIHLSGPVLARVVEDGVVIRLDEQGAGFLDSDDTVEPVLVHDFDPSEVILVRWEACLVGRQPEAANAVVRRRVIRRSDDGVAHELDPSPLELRGDGKIRCHGMLDVVPAGSLEPGSYRLEISVVHDGSDSPLAVGRTPIYIH